MAKLSKNGMFANQPFFHFQNDHGTLFNKRIRLLLRSNRLRIYTGTRRLNEKLASILQLKAA